MNIPSCLIFATNLLATFFENTGSRTNRKLFRLYHASSHLKKNLIHDTECKLNVALLLDICLFKGTKTANSYILR